MRSLFVVLLVATGTFGVAAHEAPGDALPKIAFTSSVSGTGNIGQDGLWPDTGVLTGLDAADAVCAYLAAGAGLGAVTSTWAAWMSDRDDDAYCRVHGLTGTKLGNCGGLPSLPSNAGPWVRSDGTPFAEVIYLALGLFGEVFTALEVDEHGSPLSANGSIFTATDDQGEFDDSYGDCSLWSVSSADQVRLGSTEHTTRSWGSWAAGRCADPRRIACLEVGGGGPLPVVSEHGVLAFVSSVTGRGNLSDTQDWPENGGLSGLDAADNVCRLRAAAAGLPEPDSFVAFMSDSVAGVDAVDRLSHAGPWVRVDGFKIADSTADLVDGRLATALNVTEHGQYLPNEGVWTGSGADGRSTGVDCDGWSNASGVATTGLANVVSEDWVADQTSYTCFNTVVHIYCFSNQSLTIFEDGFETGNTGEWSATTPLR